MHPTVRLLTPRQPGAVALIELTGEIEPVLARLAPGSPVRPGRIALRPLGSVDTGLVARLSVERAWLLPHGGPRIVSRLLAAALQAGCQAGHEQPERANAASARAEYPEAADEVEALMLTALPRLASPAGLALLLDQPRRWRGWDVEAHSLAEVRRRAGRLDRLLRPPLVALVGPVNAGKSTLTNALAGREASIAAAEPGTTRDYVGAVIDLGGLIVQWIDTPGGPTEDEPRDRFRKDQPGNEPRDRFRKDEGGEAGAPPAADPIEAEAQHIAAELVARADLVIAARESGRAAQHAPSGREADLFVETKADLLSAGAVAPPAGVVRCSALTGAGLAELAAAVRERLLPAADLAWDGPWLFDERLIAAAGRGA